MNWHVQRAEYEEIVFPVMILRLKVKETMSTGHIISF